MASLFASTSRRVLITGGASGIGAGIAHGLAKRGHGVVVSDMILPAAEKVAEEIRANGGKAEALQLDVSSQANITAAIASLKEPVDVLVNNAGIQHVSRLEEYPPEKFQLLLNVLLYGPCMLTRACLPDMRNKGFGRIINIGSIHALVGSPYKSAYVAAKHGLIGFSKVIALETGDTDVTINTICPAYVRTPLVDKQIAATAKEHNITEQEVISKIMLQPMPKGQFISVDEMVGVTEFLMSDVARNITAQAITIDGGWTAR